MTLAAIPAGLLPQQREQGHDWQASGKQKTATRRTRIVRGRFEQRLSRLSLWPVSAAKEREIVCLLGLS